MPDKIGYNRNRKIGRRLSKETEGRLSSAVDRLLMGQQYRQRMREMKWEESYEMYMGEAWSRNPDDPTADISNINLAFSTINTLIPFVADEDPQFLVFPYSGDSTPDNAKLLESFLNRLWQSSDVRGQESLGNSAFDWLLYGDGFVKIGYEIKMKDIYDAIGDKVENRVDIARFSVNRISPWDIWIDPYADGLNNARWICQRITLPISELRSDSRYKLPSNDDEQIGWIDTDNIDPEDRLRLDDVDTAEWVSIYEFYDLRENWMMAFTAGGEHAVRYIEHIQCPIIQMSNYRIPSSPYHMGELEQMRSLQIELNKTRSQMMTHRRRNVAKWVVRSQLMNTEAEEAMKSSRINEIVPIDAAEPIEHLIQYVAPQPISQDSYAMDAQLRSDINEITGVNEYLRGMPQNISRTATEASIIEGATNIRTRHKLLAVERTAQQIGQMLLDIVRDVLPLTDFEEMSQYVTGREAERINRAIGAENPMTDIIFTPTPEIFEGRYEVRVERGSTELRNPMVRAQQLQGIVSVMLNATPLLMQMGVPFNIQKLLALWLETEGIEDVDAYFEMTEDQSAMQELSLMERLMQMSGAQAGMGGASGSPDFAGGFLPAPGQPNTQGLGGPQEAPTPENSGMLAPAPY